MSAPAGMERGTCLTCRAPVLWVTTTAEARMPVEIVPDEDGNVLLGVTAGDRQLRARVLSPHARAAAIGQNVRLWMPHYATSPRCSAAAAVVRRRRDATAAGNQRVLAERGVPRA